MKTKSTDSPESETPSAAAPAAPAAAPAPVTAVYELTTAQYGPITVGRVCALMGARLNLTTDQAAKLNDLYPNAFQLKGI
jgi:hypothetical protein